MNSDTGWSGEITQRSSNGFQKRKKNWTGKEGSIPRVWLGVPSSLCSGAFSRLPPTQHRGQYSKLFSREKPWAFFHVILKTDINFKF